MMSRIFWEVAHADWYRSAALWCPDPKRREELRELGRQHEARANQLKKHLEDKETKR